MVGTARTGMIALKFTLPYGDSDTNTSPQSCLFRPFSVLATQGKLPGGRMSPVLVRDIPHLHYCLGSFCYTVGNRLLFFPGTHLREITEYGDGESVRPMQFLVDHFTLEKDSSSWHATSQAGGHIRSVTLGEIAPGVIYWFGLSLDSCQRLERAHLNSIFIFTCELSDHERRRNQATHMVQNPVTRVIRIPDIPKPSETSTFVHFDFVVVTDPGVALPEQFTRLPPYPALVGLTQNRTTTEVVDIRFPELGKKVFVTCSVIAGELGQPIVVNWV